MRTVISIAVLPLALACGGGSDPTGDTGGNDPTDVTDPPGGTPGDPAAQVETEGTLVASGHEGTTLDVDDTMMAQLTPEGIELRLETGMHNVHFRSGTGFVTPILGELQDTLTGGDTIGETEIVIPAEETVAMSAGERCTDVVGRWLSPDGTLTVSMLTTEDGHCTTRGFSPYQLTIGDNTATPMSGPCQGSVFQIVEDTITVDCGVGPTYTLTRLNE